MPPQHRRGGRGGRGGADGGGGGRQGGGGASPGEFRTDMRRGGGGGRGIPDFKENPRAKQTAGHTEGQQAEGDASAPPAKFNAQEASEWMALRHQTVMDEYEKQKANGKKGDIQNFADMNSERSAWTSSKPVIPPKEDFLFQLQMALAQTRKQPDEKGAA
mmetsp:Transcript_60530/g.169047  ORF Transcript_60530/g.169047 Transcript_60530/m.169047 type:complete len:160 (-) Transcript_60530:168-647(-)